MSHVEIAFFDDNIRSLLTLTCNLSISLSLFIVLLHEIMYF